MCDVSGHRRQRTYVLVGPLLCVGGGGCWVIQDLNITIADTTTGQILRELTLDPTRDCQPRSDVGSGVGPADADVV